MNFLKLPIYFETQGRYSEWLILKVFIAHASFTFPSQIKTVFD